MMQVLHIMADGSPGGGPTVVQTLCEYLEDFGVNAAVVTQTNSYLSGQARAAGIRTYEADFSRRMKAWQVSSRLQEILSDVRPDVLLAHGARSTMPAALLGRCQRPPLVHVVHGLHYTKKPLLARVLGRTIERFCVSRADHTVFVAKADATLAKRHHLLGQATYNVILNGVAVPPRLERKLDDRQFDIAFVGRLHAQKDPLILPEILLAMRPQRPSMLIVAGGDLEQALRAKIKAADVGEQIVFAGARPRHEALDLLSQARVCVLPSLWEGLPVSLAEAMLLRVAVVASDIPGNNEIIGSETSGLLVPAGDARGFANSITRLLTSDNLRHTLTLAAAERARLDFSAVGQARAYFRLFGSILRDRPSAETGVQGAV